VPVAIETSRGLLVACLRATGRPVYAINPMAAARYRDRHAVDRKISDHLDAMVLANVLRTDAAAHRMLPRDTDTTRLSSRWPHDMRTRVHHHGGRPGCLGCSGKYCPACLPAPRALVAHENQERRPDRFRCDKSSRYAWQGADWVRT